MAFPVKWYSNAMQGAPSLGDTSAGALAALLKAVLVTGFGTLTLTSLVWDATEGAAKATIAGGHAYLQDSVVEVSGASPAASTRANTRSRALRAASGKRSGRRVSGDCGRATSNAASAVESRFGSLPK